jgi:hypothetical protein
MANIIEAFVAFDTSKLRNAVALAEAGRAGEVRFLGEIENTEAAVAKLVRKLATADVRSGPKSGARADMPGRPGGAKTRLSKSHQEFAKLQDIAFASGKKPATGGCNSGTAKPQESFVRPPSGGSARFRFRLNAASRWR